MAKNKFDVPNNIFFQKLSFKHFDFGEIRFHNKKNSRRKPAGSILIKNYTHDFI